MQNFLSKGLEVVNAVAPKIAEKVGNAGLTKVVDTAQKLMPSIQDAVANPTLENIAGAGNKMVENLVPEKHQELAKNLIGLGQTIGGAIMRNNSPNATPVQGAESLNPRAEAVNTAAEINGKKY